MSLSLEDALEQTRLFIGSEAQRHLFPQKTRDHVLVGFRHFAAGDIKISLDRQGNLEVLDVNVVLPDVVLEKPL